MSEAKVILDVVSGPMEGNSFVFDSHDTFIFGRHHDCHAQIADDTNISRHHFLLELNPPDLRIKDLGSLNGTLVNDRCLGGPNAQPAASGNSERPSVDLKDGDEIRVGGTTFLVRVIRSYSCHDCGCEISHEDHQRLPTIGDSILCERCWRLSTTEAAESSGIGLNAAPPPAPLYRCDQCGKDITHEQSSRQGEYICNDCRSQAEEESGGFRRIFELAAQRRKQTATPLAIEGYEILEEIGRGGMGVVYRAIRLEDNLETAVKVMLARVAVDDINRKNFVREIKVMAQLKHPNIAGLLDCGAVGSLFYCTMEYCGFGSLDRLVAVDEEDANQSRGASLDQAGPIMLQTLAGLAYAHREGIVHRDLKPQNILLHDIDGQPNAKVSDFGLAKNFEQAGLSGMTTTGDYAGTFRYMPREQLTDFRFVQPVSDVWSVAATFYFLLTGHHPLVFQRNRDPMEVLLRDNATPIRDRSPNIQPSLAEVIDRALLTDPTERYQNAGEMREAVAAALQLQ